MKKTLLLLILVLTATLTHSQEEPTSEELNPEDEYYPASEEEEPSSFEEQELHEADPGEEGTTASPPIVEPSTASQEQPVVQETTHQPPVVQETTEQPPVVQQATEQPPKVPETTQQPPVVTPERPRPRLPEIKSEDLEQLVSQTPLVLVLLGNTKCSQECIRASEVLVDIAENTDLEDFRAVHVTDDALHQNVALRLSVNFVVLLYRKNTTPVYINPHLTMKPQAILNHLEDVARHEPQLKSLNDDSFEHETQAATGATTGDWLVIFHDGECLKENMKITFETLATQFSHEYVNTAMVNTKTNTRLKKRFGVKKCPEIYLFRKGKQYLFPMPSRTITFTDLEAFPKNTYKYSKNGPVAVEPTPFDEFTSQIALKIKEFMSGSTSANVRYSVIGGISAAIVSLMLLICCCCCCKSKTEPGLPHTKHD
ncbi:uncharacterized protein LOC141913977 [Tubulanus polymorphus]|uniref:uncharacterized protein LOC141913977 n=1 Tax=Tubulanus polymorphus TaxID=672921 RepID=UPI003DA64587